MSDDQLPLSSATSIQNTITVESVRDGMVVGTNTGSITRNYYESDTYNHIEIYVLSAAGRTSGLSNLISPTTEPYKFLAPYGTVDSPIFKGRENEVEQLDRFIHERKLVVLTGEASVGKTSLLAAGVIPKLLDEGLMCIKIQEYRDTVAVISEALKQQQQHLQIPLPENPSLPELIHAIVKALNGTLVLVLDQFELLFESSIETQQREQFIKDLATCLREIQSNLLRVVIAIRYEATTQLSEFQDEIPELLQPQLHLNPLTQKQAALAIREPLLAVKSRVQIHGEVIERLLLPDLAELGAGGPNLVHPPYLQIVCSWLYRTSTATNPPRVIDEQMLTDANGAQGIFADYLEEILNTKDERERSSRVLELMARPDAEMWITPAQLHEMNAGVPDTSIEEPLQTLVRAGLVVRRAVDGKYAFASPVIAREVVRLAGPAVERMNRAENEVERIWLSWLGREAFASADQLRYLESFGADLNPRAVKAMLLLRSAVEHHESTSPWLDLLNREEGRALMVQVEGLPALADAAIASELVLTKVETLLELPVNGAGASTPAQYTSVGRVSLNAVSHADSSVRQTCALALTAISGDKQVALDRLTTALSKTKNGLRLRAELRGALADADETIEKLNKSLRWSVRIAIWRWRALRRIAQDRRRWLVLVLGGALGAGFGLALVRALIAAFTPTEQPGIQFSMYLYYGFVLGGLLTLGMSWAKPLLLRGNARTDNAPVSEDPSLSTFATPLAVVMGGVFFGLAHILVTIFNGLSPVESPLVIPLGFVAGIGSSLSIFFFHHLRSWYGWLIAILCIIVVWVSVQWIFTLSEPSASAVTVVNGAWYYEGKLRNYPQLATTNLASQLALFDAALAGISLTVGLFIGLRQARKYLNRRAQKKTSALE
ncbi:MAG TPA: ATP-binding protein [Pyrinomonadaceae bacterium]|nr:ATP-binding protein [Pyrinomonadaceae bacterium]